VSREEVKGTPGLNTTPFLEKRGKGDEKKSRGKKPVNRQSLKKRGTRKEKKNFKGVILIFPKSRRGSGGKTWGKVGDFKICLEIKKKR